jgi:ATP-dependent helicase/nuclease subunit B
MASSAQLEVLVGPAGSGKTWAALDEYQRVLAAQPLGPRRRGLWLAPTQAAANAVRDWIAAERSGALLDPGVRTFARFAGEVVWDAGLRVTVISPLERRRLLRRAILEAARDGKLAHFNRVADSPGLVNVVDEAIAGLKRRDVSADEFATGGGSPTPRRRDLAELYGRYETLLKAGRLTDPEGLFLAARDGIIANCDVGTGIELVVVDGFTDFTVAQLEILRVIAERTRRVLVTLVGDRDDGPKRADLFAKTMATREALAKLRPDVTELESPQVDVRAFSPALAHLERNLFRDFGETEPVSATVRRSLPHISIVAASSVQAEMEEIARRVKALLLGGAPPEEVAVVFPSTREAAERVRGAFDDFGIPTRLDARPRLAATALVRSLLSVLRLHAEDWPYRRLLQVIGDQSLRAFAANGDTAQWPAASEAAAALERQTVAEECVRHAQLARGRDPLLEQIAAWAADESGLAPVHAATASIAAVFLQTLADALGQLPISGKVEDWIASLTTLTNGLGLSSPSQDKVWQTLIHGLRTVDRVDAATGLKSAELKIGDVVDLISHVASELAAPEETDATGRVQVLSAEAARFIRPRHLFIGGLSEQAFAGRSAASEDLEQDDVPAADSSAAAQSTRSDEMLLFYQVVTRATESLTLSYPALDAKAQAMPPSPLLVELERCFGGELEEFRQPLAYQAKLEGEPLSRSDLRRQAVASAQARKRDLLAAMVRSPRFEALGNSLLDGIEAVASRSDRRKFGPYEGLFSSDEVQAILERKYGSDFCWSPSLLETYAACPFKFFSEQVLRLQPMPELVLESDPARRGSVLHDTLARLYGRLNAQAEAGGPKPTPEAVAAHFQELLDAIVRGRPGRGLDGALREIERRQIAAWAQKFAEQHETYAAAWQHLDEPLVPRYFEARFGPKNRRSQAEHDAALSTDEPYELAVGNERLRFTGTIDRIDVGRVGDTLVFNVIDYKTSAQARLRPEHIESGMQIQLPLYAMAVAELLLADKQAAALSVGYWSVRGKGFSIGARTGGPLSIGEIRDGKVQMSAQWSQLRESLLGRIGELVGGIRRGRFPVYSEEKTCTQYCPYSTCCRIAHVRALEKVWPASAGETGIENPSETST